MASEVLVNIGSGKMPFPEILLTYYQSDTPVGKYMYYKNMYLKLKEIQISLKFVPEGAIYNISALVHVMAWHQGHNELSLELS